MDLRSARRFRVSSRSLVPIIAVFTILAACVFWSIRQSALTKQDRLRAMALEHQDAARVKADAERSEARTKRNAELAAADARLQQLYREIDALSRINEHLIAQPARRPDAAAKTDALEGVDDGP